MEHTDHASEGSGAKEMFLRTVAIVGLVAVLILGAWGIIVLAFNLPNFLGTVGNSVSTLFTAPGKTLTATPATTNTTNSPAATGGKGSTPTATYTPSAQSNRANLYGLPDLAVRILSITPVNNAYNYQYGYAGSNRLQMQFEVVNVGTNVARSGWSFNASLPLSPVYTFVSQQQQALYPGDKIVYSLGFDAPTGYSNSYYNYQPQTCYHYDGYTNTPYQCNYAYDQTNPNYNYGNTNGLVTVTVDPMNWLYENSKANNTTSQVLGGNNVYPYPVTY